MRRSGVSLAVFCLLFTASFSFAQNPSAQPQITQPVDEQTLTSLSGNTHPMARAQFDQGPAPLGLPMERMLLVLKRSPVQESALRALVDNQQDKSSSSYHKWLTPDEFGQQFGPADADVQTVTTWLQLHGFQVARVSHSKGVIEFSGTAGQVQQTFHTAIHKYTVNGEDHWANASDPQIPSALAPTVAGVLSLHNFQKKSSGQFAGTFTRDRTTGEIKPVNPTFTFPAGCDQDNNCYAVGPYDFATIYNVLPQWTAGIDGTGQTIAIVGRTNINIQDVRDFRTLFGLPANDPNIILNGPDPGINSDEGEADIDVQWSGAVAKGATIDFVTSQSTETTDGIDLSAEYIVDNNLAPVMSESYGQCELALGTAGNAFFNSLWEQAAAQGITVMVSTGDNGSAGCDFGAQAQYGLQVSGIASTPFNVAVGGTDFDDFSNPQTYWNTINDPSTQVSAKGYIPETTWNDSCTNGILATVGFSTNPETNCNNSQLSGLWDTIGGSGGYSRCTVNSQVIGSCSGGYSKPSWQTGAGVPADGKRDLPDVSLFASNGFVGNFYVVCQRDTSSSNTCDLNYPYFDFAGYGGTSVSSPAFAGIMALVNQKTGSRQGVANYVLYKLAGQQSASTCNSSNGSNSFCNFNDVTKGTISVPCLTGSPYCQTNVLGDPFGVLTGYTTTTAYDLATGLGSVNVNNIVNNWHTVTFKPSTTTLSITPTTGITHGQSVNVSIGVTGTGGTPTGNVSLLTSAGQSVPGFTLANGNVTGTTALLPGGTYNVTAHYAGDATYGGSDSNAVSVTVAKENSKTFVDLVTVDVTGVVTSFAASGATYGAGYPLLRVDVGDSAASVSPTTGISSGCSAGSRSCPTGALAVTNNGTPFAGGSWTLNNRGYAEYQQLIPGTYSITASYAGDASYSPSNGALNFTVSPAPTTAQAAVSGLPVQYGNFEQIDGSVFTTSTGVAPTGTFTFFVDGVALGGPVPVYESFAYNPNTTPVSYAFADATSSTEFIGLGNHNLTVQYSGDSNYAPSTSAPSVVNVTQALPFFSTWGALPSLADWNQPVTLTATLLGSQSGVAPSGAITFMDGNTVVPGSVAYTPGTHDLTATLSYTPGTPGTHNISAQFAGDTFYLPSSTPVAAMLQVNGPFSITPSGIINITAPGQPGSTVLTVSSNNGFSGTVTLSCVVAQAHEANCSFSTGSSSAATAQVNVSGGTSPTVTLNITTTAPSAASGRKSFPGMNLGGLTFGMVAVLWLPFTQRPRRIKRLILLSCIFLLTGCGGGSSSSNGGNTDPGTTAGTYTVTVSGVTGMGSTAVTVTAPVTVTIQ